MLPRLTKWLRNSRKIRRCLQGLACFALLVVLFYAEEDWRGKRAWEQYKREWEAKGEHFDFANFVPPAVPNDQNFALTPVVFSTSGGQIDRHGNVIEPLNTNVVNRLYFPLESPSEWKRWPTNDFMGHWEFGIKVDLKVFQTYYRAPVNTNQYLFQTRGRGGRFIINPVLNATNDFPLAPQPQSPAADVLLALSKYDAAIEELRQATRLPHSRFPHNYDDSPVLAKVFIPALAGLKQCSQLLRLRAAAELESGLNGKAMDDVKLMLYLARSLREEPFLTSQLVRASMINITIQPLWEGLHDHKWSDPQLADLAQEIARLDSLSDYQFIVRSERAADIDWLDYMERSRSFHDVCAAFFPFQVDPDGVSSWDRRLEETKFYLMPGGWFYQNDLVVTRILQQSLPTDVETGRRELNRGIAERTEKAMSISAKHFSPCNSIALAMSGGVSRLTQKFAFAQSSLDQARVACALERFRLAHEEYPATLELLSPQFIDQIPHDVIDGGPLHYRHLDDDQFLLYSVGWNGTDDGGITVRTAHSWTPMKDLDKGDWVWPNQPVPSPSPAPSKASGRYQGPVNQQGS